MFSHRHYVPILKMKRGELDALAATSPQEKVLMTPLLEALLNIDEGETDTSVIASALADRLTQVANKWGRDRRFFLDLSYLEDVLAYVPAAQLCSIVGGCVPEAIVVVHHDMSAVFASQMRALAHSQARGYCLRVTDEDVPFVHLIQQLLNRFELPVGSIDLVLDLRSVFGQTSHIINLRTTSLMNMFPLTGFRTVTLAASAFPAVLSMVMQANQVTFIPRDDWSNWVSVIQQAAYPRLPSFGDYSINHPDLAEGGVPRASAPNLRYTLDNVWYLAKGQGPQYHPAGNRQFHTICQALVASGHFAGAHFSWGDGEIDTYATGAAALGNTNAEIWRKVGFSHHFAKVITQI